MVFKIFRPQTAGFGIVSPAIFHIQRFKAAFLHGCQYMTDMRQFTMREYIFPDEFASAIACAFVAGTGSGDAVIHRQSVIGQQAADFIEIQRQIFQAYMFEHTDTGDAFEAAFDIAIVFQHDLDL